MDFFRVFLHPGVDQAAAKERILTRFADHRRVFVLSSREVRDYVEGLTDQWFGMTRVQVIIAILVAILGIVNSLTVTIADRRRELGILQAVGALRIAGPHGHLDGSRLHRGDRRPARAGGGRRAAVPACWR